MKSKTYKNKRKGGNFSNIYRYLFLSSFIISIFCIYYTYFEIVISPKYYIIRGSGSINEADVALSFALLLNASSIVSNGDKIFSDTNLHTMSMYSNSEENIKPCIQEVTEYSFRFLGSDTFSLLSFEVFNINLVDTKKLLYKVTPVESHDEICDLSIYYIYNNFDKTITFYPHEIFGLNVFNSYNNTNLDRIYKMILNTLYIKEVFYLKIQDKLYKITK